MATNGLKSHCPEESLPSGAEQKEGSSGTKRGCAGDEKPAASEAGASQA